MQDSMRLFLQAVHLQMHGLVILVEFPPVHVNHHRRKAHSPGSVSNVTNTRMIDNVLSSQGTLGFGCGPRVLGHHHNRALVLSPHSVKECPRETSGKGNLLGLTGFMGSSVLHYGGQRELTSSCLGGSGRWMPVPCGSSFPSVVLLNPPVVGMLPHTSRVGFPSAVLFFSTH